MSIIISIIIIIIVRRMGSAGNGEGIRTTDGGSQQGATLYDAPASAPVGRCSARKRACILGTLRPVVDGSY